ncbi:MAG: prepilin peptidase [Alphaproteobacteria bacterium]|nr:prepilin peptidase [Alphaproteobacteria bacterium]
MIEPVLLATVSAAMITAAAYDATTLTIPNWISLLLFAVFPVLAFSSGMGWAESGVHLAIGLAALAIGIALFAANLIGGGDAKLFAAVCLYMGSASVASFVFAVALAGGLLACAVLAIRSVALTGITTRFSWLHRLSTSGTGIPYGVAIAAGGLFVFPATHLFALASGY